MPTEDDDATEYAPGYRLPIFCGSLWLVFVGILAAAISLGWWQMQVASGVVVFALGLVTGSGFYTTYKIRQACREDAAGGWKKWDGPAAG